MKMMTSHFLKSFVVGVFLVLSTIVVSNYKVFADELEVISLPVEVFFPSDRSRPTETMLKLKGDVTITPVDSDGYDFMFAFNLRPAREKSTEAKPYTIEAELAFSDDMDELAIYSPELIFIPIEKDGIINKSTVDAGLLFSVIRKQGQKWRLGDFDVLFLDVSGAVVAGVRLPLFIPVKINNQ